MNFTVEDGEKAEEEKYPYIGVFPNGQLVLFHAEETGVCVGHIGEMSFRLGEYSSGWAESRASKYDGKVILAND